MRVLIIGYNGFVGPSIARHACTRGHDVFGMGRSLQPTPVTDALYIAGDRSDFKNIRQIVLQRKIEVVVDVIPMVLANTQHYWIVLMASSINTS